MATIGSFDELMDGVPPELRAIASQLRAAILALHPDVTEVVRLGDRAATYGVGPRKMKDGYAYIMPHKRWVNLGFYQGAALPDPGGLLDGAGKKMRHIKVRDADMAGSQAVRALLAAAHAEREAAT